MTDPRAGAVLAAEQLRLALDGIADAIRGARLEDLLGAEDRLLAALAAVAQVREVGPADRLDLRLELTRAREALETCRQLGAIVRQVSDGYLVAQGRGGEYDRSGSSTALGRRGSGLEVRI